MSVVRDLTTVLSSVVAGGIRAPAGASQRPSGAADTSSRSTTPREEAALRRARSVSQLLDEAVRVPGTDFRVGLDPLLSVVPVGGDTVGAALSLYPIVEAYRLGAPRRTLAAMVLLVAIDAVIGSVPIAGTVFDAFWKANTWNVGLLERHVESR